MGHFVWNYLNSFTRQHYVKASKGPWLLWKYHVVNGTGYSIYVQTYLEGCKINFLQFSNCVNNILLDDLGPINIFIPLTVRLAANTKTLYQVQNQEILQQTLSQMGAVDALIFIYFDHHWATLCCLVLASFDTKSFIYIIRVTKPSVWDPLKS